MNDKGQTLIETIIAVAVIGIVVTALIGMGVVAMKTAASARNQSQAVKLANEEMELVRSFRDSSDADKGFSNLSCAVQCYIDASTSIVAKTETVQSIFTRFFTTSDVTAEKKKIDVTVTWAESGGTKSVSVSSYLTNWR